MKKIILALIIIIISLSLIFLFIQTEEPVKLDGVEIKDYRGEKLSSINDFRENSIIGPQYIDKESYRLNISGLVENPKTYTYDEVINDHKSYKKVVTLDCVEGWNATILWEGIMVRDLIKEAKAKESAKVVIIHAHDGYTTSFPIDYIMDNDIIMAYKMNDVFIPPERGFPFQIVAEDKWGYKWTKWVTEIELSDDVEYRGTWEARGYSDDANLNESFISS